MVVHSEKGLNIASLNFTNLDSDKYKENILALLLIGRIKMKRFDRFIKIIFINEGGSKIVNDSGGATKWGISKKAHPDIDIERLTQKEAKEIYYRDYYLKINADKIKEGMLALQFFDMAVNAGVKQASKLLQRLVGVKADGIIGPISLKAINSKKKLAFSYMEERFKYYSKLSNQYPQYQRGWILRIFRTY